MAELLRQLAVMLTGILSSASGYLRREETHEQTVFVGCPHGAVTAQKTGAGAFLAAETARTVEQTACKPLESHGHLAQAAACLMNHPVDQTAADQSLADRGLETPLRTV